MFNIVKYGDKFMLKDMDSLKTKKELWKIKKELNMENKEVNANITKHEELDANIHGNETWWSKLKKSLNKVINRIKANFKNDNIKREDIKKRKDEKKIKKITFKDETIKIYKREKIKNERIWKGKLEKWQDTVNEKIDKIVEYAKIFLDKIYMFSKIIFIVETIFKIKITQNVIEIILNFFQIS